MGNTPARKSLGISPAGLVVFGIATEGSGRRSGSGGGLVEESKEKKGVEERKEGTPTSARCPASARCRHVHLLANKSCCLHTLPEASASALPPRYSSLSLPKKSKRRRREISGGRGQREG